MTDGKVGRIVFSFLFCVVIVLGFTEANPIVYSDDGKEKSDYVPLTLAEKTSFVDSSEVLNHEVMPRYGLRPPNMVLVLHSDGRVSSHWFDTGAEIWSYDTGGSVLYAKIEEHASEETQREDPLSVPFWVHGDMLFTRRRFQPTSTTDQEQSKDGSNVFSSLFPLSPKHPNYFKNISELIRKRHMRVGETDIFVDTKTKIMDVSSYDGKPLQSTGSLLPHLHIVRYEISLNAVRRDTYKWQINVAQYKFSEGSFWRASGSKKEEGRPRFISRVLQALLHEDDLAQERQILGDGSYNLELRSKAVKQSIDKFLFLKEEDVEKYRLWDAINEVSLWSFTVSSAADVVGAYLWMTDRGEVHRLAVRRLVSPPTSTALVSTMNKEAKEFCGQPSTRDVDIDADEREARELHNSYEKCLSFYPVVPSLPDVPNETALVHNPLETFQFIPTMSLLWSFTAARRTVFIIFHVFFFFVSLALVCFGVMPRRRLRNAWAQLDSLMDDLRHSSRPNSSKLLPMDRAVRQENVPFSENGTSGTSATPLILSSSGTVLKPVTPAKLSLDSNSDGLHPLPMVASSAAHQYIEDGADDWWRNSGSVGDDLDSQDGYSSGTGLDSTRRTISSQRQGRREKLQTQQQLQGNSNNGTPQLFQQHFCVIEKIGWGAEGSVFCVEHRVTRSKYAMKVILITSEDQERCVQEAVLHSSFDFQNVVRFYYCWIEEVSRSLAECMDLLGNDDSLDTRSVYTDDSSPAIAQLDSTLSSTTDVVYRMLFIQMEYFQRGTLADYFRKRDRFTRLENLNHLLQIAEGLRYIHHQHVVHRDLKPTNIFVSDSGVMKIGDFGLAKRRTLHSNSIRSLTDELGVNFTIKDEERSVAGGSPLYCSPEQLQGHPATASSDVYSLGVVAVESYCLFNTTHERLRTLEEARRGVFHEELIRDFPEEMKLFGRMLCDSKEGRPTLDHVIQSLFHIMRREKKGKSKVERKSDPLQQIDDDSGVSLLEPTTIDQRGIFREKHDVPSFSSLDSSAMQ